MVQEKILKRYLVNKKQTRSPQKEKKNQTRYKNNLTFSITYID